VGRPPFHSEALSAGLSWTKGGDWTLDLVVTGGEKRKKFSGVGHRPLTLQARRSRGKVYQAALQRLSKRITSRFPEAGGEELKCYPQLNVIREIGARAASTRGGDASISEMIQTSHQL